jgi:hypothetical protein
LWHSSTQDIETVERRRATHTPVRDAYWPLSLDSETIGRSQHAGQDARRYRNANMNNKLLAQIIRWVNKREHPDQIFVAPGPGSVRKARVWLRRRGDAGARFTTSYDFWFVFVDDDCAAAILDMKHDLHVYTRLKHRRRGLMLNALATTVLPSLASDGLDEQQVEYRSAPAKALLTKLNATFLNDRYAKIDLAPYKHVVVPSSQTIGLTAERRDAMRAKLRTAAQLVEMVRDELRLTTGQDLPSLAVRG